jgi:hypothetical protein
VKDLGIYLGKMSGTEIGIVEGLPPNDKRLTIHIGAEAQQRVGPMGISKSGLFGFHIVADGQRGIGLYGESEVGTSYAIYEPGRFPVNEFPVFRPLSPVLSPPATRHYQRMLARRHNGGEGLPALPKSPLTLPSPPNRCRLRL